MANKPGRLYRKLNPTSPLFEFTYGSTILTDASIRSVKIHRGGDGVSPSTIEVETIAFASVATGDSCRLQLSTAGEALVMGSTGSGAKPRFTGRIGQQLVDDQGGTKQYTNFMGASLTAQHPALRKKYSFAAGALVRDVIRDILQQPSLPAITVTNLDAVGNYGSLHEAATDQTYQDLIGKVTTDLGIQARDTRAGTIQLLTHEFRHNRAVANMGLHMPIGRSQALSSTQWEQANETRPRNYLLKYRNISGGLVQGTYGDTSDLNAEVVDLDMSHIRFSNTTQPTQEAFARRAREWLSGYALPNIKIDLLYLLSTGNPYHVEQAKSLLQMEVNDALYFSGDWHPNLRGINYAEQITETIDSNTWELELTLKPSQEVTGYVSPAVPARTWDQADHAWDTETRTWNEA